MRTLNSLTAILLMMTMSLSSHVSGQRNYVASNATTMHFVGNIAGKLKIRMTLTQRDINQRKSGEPIGTAFRGFLVYVKHPKDIIRMSGFYNPQGVGGAEGYFDLTETVKGKETGTFEVRS